MAAKIAFDADAFMKRRIGEIVQKAGLKIKSARYIDKLGKELEKIGDKTIAGIFPFIANNLIGTKSGKSTGDEFRPFIGPKYPGAAEGVETLIMKRIQSRQVSKKYRGVSWKPLSGRSIKEKGNDQFFVRTGKLRQKFLGTNAIDKVGGFRVNRFEQKLRADVEGGSIALNSRVTTTVLIGYLRFNVFAKISNWLDRLYAGDFDEKASLEKRLFGADYGRKLEGFNPIRKSKHTFMGGDYHRPMVQPVLAFYLDNVIPNAIARSLLRRQQRNRTK